jgi:hypothetical protein
MPVALVSAIARWSGLGSIIRREDRDEFGGSVTFESPRHAR